MKKPVAKAINEFQNQLLAATHTGLHHSNLFSYGNGDITTESIQGHKVCHRNHKASDCWRSLKKYKSKLRIWWEIRIVAWTMSSRHFTSLRGRYWDRTSDPHNVNVVLYR